MDTRGLDALIRKVERTMGPTEVKRALRPAAKTIRKAVQGEAPRRSESIAGRPAPGRLRRSVKVKAVRGAPILLVAVARELALTVSRRYPRGFPYVNWIISRKGRGSRADKFVRRGFERVQNAARGDAVAGLLSALRSTGRVK